MDKPGIDTIKTRRKLVQSAAVLWLLSSLWVYQSPGQEQSESTHLAQSAGLTLSQLEQMALSNHPSLAQAAADIRAAEARKRQAGLYPNPTVGYQGEQIRGGIQGGGEQGFFVAQDVVTGGKLGLNRQIAEQDRKLAEVEAEKQKQRVLNRVRISYYAALANQEMVALQGDQKKLADDAVRTTQELENVGQADKPDLLQAEVEADQAELAVVEAEQNQKRAWAELAASVGRSDMPIEHLAGDLTQLPGGNSSQWLQAILQESPAVKMAQIREVRARASLRRSKKEVIPDLQLRGGLQQNLETNETTGRAFGLQGFAEAGMQIPIFNRNQGNVSAAEAELERARQEVQRAQLALRESAAGPIENYEISLAAVTRYRDRMIPHAQEAYELYSSRYKQMAVAYPQVLIAQRTLFQLRAGYLMALQRLWTNAVLLQGHLVVDAVEPAATASQGIGSQSGSVVP